MVEGRSEMVEGRSAAVAAEVDRVVDTASIVGQYGWWFE
jgi:hypothetical protein